MLSLLIRNNEIAYCISDARQKKHLALRAYLYESFTDLQSIETALTELTESEPILQQSFQQVTIGVAATQYTILPTEWHTPGTADDYLNFNHQIDGEASTHLDHLEKQRLTIPWSIPTRLSTKIKSLFPDAKMHFAGATMLSQVLTENRYSYKKKLFVHVSQQQFDLFYLEKDNLLLFNSFEFKAVEDFIYYTLFACEQLKENPEEVALVILGEIAQDSQLYGQLTRYFKNISFGTRAPGYRFSYQFSFLPLHFYYNLFCIPICGL